MANSETYNYIAVFYSKHTRMYPISCAHSCLPSDFKYPKPFIQGSRDLKKSSFLSFSCLKGKGEREGNTHVLIHTQKVN
jgi:hypothetical protein